MTRYQEEFGLPEYDTEIITSYKHLADLIEAAEAICHKPKEVSNWIMGETMRLAKEYELEPEKISFSPEHLAKIIEMVDAGEINRKVAKNVFQKVFTENVDPEEYVEKNGLKSVSDEGALRGVIEEIVAKNPQSVEDYRAGKKKAMGFLVGQTMKAMQGKADPAIVNQILKEILEG